MSSFDSVGTPMALDLENLKTEILAQLKRKGFAIFFSDGEAEGLDVIYWDTKRYPDFRLFLDAAQQCGVKMVVFYERLFSQASIDDMLERVEDSDLSREEKRSYELRLHELQKYEGFTGQLSIYFEVGTHLYEFEVRSPWFEDFEDIFVDVTVGETENNGIAGEDEDPMSGYFSRN